MSKEKEIKRKDIGGGFELEAVETFPDKDGNKLEVFLYFLGELFDGISNNDKFKDITDAMNVYMNILIPSFILNANRKEGEVKNIKYLKSETMMIKFVEKFLYNNRSEICYGAVIDIIQGLDDFGYLMPDPTDYAKKEELDAFYLSVNAINKVLLSKLYSTGFGPDRNMSNTHDQDIHSFRKDDFCNNIAFTRYPWTPGYRMIYSAKVFGRVSDGDFIRNQDMGEWSELYPDFHKPMVMLEDKLKDVHVEVINTFHQTGFEDSAERFENLIDGDRAELVKVWKKKKPSGFKEFIKEYRKEQSKYGMV